MTTGIEVCLVADETGANFWLHCETALLAEGWADNVRIGVSGRRIADVQKEGAPQPSDIRLGIVLPGMANLHSHAFQRGMAGLAEQRGRGPDSFWTWRETMYRFVAALSPDDLEAIATQAYVEMLESGFTRVGEFHYLHHAGDGRPYSNVAEMSTRIAAAAAQSEIGLTLLPVFYAHGGFGGLPLQKQQLRFANTLESYAKLLEGCRNAVHSLGDAVVGVAPHSLRAVTSEQLRAVVVMGGYNPIHIHIAEQVREIDECLAWSGARPVAWLHDQVDLDQRWCLVHATHMDQNETVRLAASGAVAGLCPITEANLGDGLFAAPSYLGAGGQFGIGTDSNVLIDMREEFRLLEYGQRLRDKTRNILTSQSVPSVGRTLFDGALKGGAQALAWRGGICVDARADLVSLSSDQPILAARNGDSLLDSFIFGHGRISDVWSGGRKVVSNGAHRARDAVSRRYTQVLQKLQSL